MTFASSFGRVFSPSFQPKSQAVAGGTFTFYPVADTYTNADYKTFNEGTRDCLLISGYSQTWKLLIRFDVSSIPTGTIPSSASIRFTMGDPVSSSYNINLHIYSISSANGDWIEGTKKGQLAGSGEPCFNAKAADGSGGVTTAWAGSGGLNTAGTDYESTSLGSVTQDRGATNGTQFTINLNADGLNRIKGWFGNGATNYGIVLIPNSYIFSNVYSRESATVSYRPLLTITY